MYRLSIDNKNFFPIHELTWHMAGTCYGGISNSSLDKSKTKRFCCKLLNDPMNLQQKVECFNGLMYQSKQALRQMKPVLGQGHC